MRLRGFVPLDELLTPDARREPARTEPALNGTELSEPAPMPAPPARVIDDWERRVSLFGEPEG